VVDLVVVEQGQAPDAARFDVQILDHCEQIAGIDERLEPASVAPDGDPGVGRSAVEAPFGGRERPS
jgi:hypothetical protein